MSGPLLTTKLYAPPPRHDQVGRPHLVQRLNEAVRRGHRLILLSAPAGFGKTTLLGEWLEGGGAWLSLDAGDNDPARFLAYLIGALRTLSADSHLVETTLAQLQLPQPPAMEGVLASLLNELPALPRPTILVLDDYHTLETHAVHGIVATLVDRLPPGVHLVVATRADPPLPLARLRARGEMTELRAHALRFSEAEAAAFLNEQIGLDLNREEVAALEARTEGWIAGLQLVALALQATVAAQGREAIPPFVEAFAGDDRYIADYLVEEVLQRQPEAIRTFLLHTSVLEQLCASLCNAVLGLEEAAAAAPASQQILEHLEDHNLFVVPLDRTRLWYRYHRLFAELLRHRLQQAYPDRVRSLHRRASQWYARHGLPEEAVGHALAAQEFAQAAAMIASMGWTLLAHGEIGTLARWMGELPGAAVRAQPRLGLLRGWLLIFTMELDRVEPTLSWVEATLGEAGDVAAFLGEAAAIRATLASMQADAVATIEHSQRALAHLPDEHPLLRGIVADILGTAHALQGDARAAEAAFSDAAELSQAAGNALMAQIALGNLAGVQESQGRLRLAAATCRRALDMAREAGKGLLPVSGMAHIGLGRLHTEWNELETAEQHLEWALALARQGSIPELVVAGQMAASRLWAARGEETDAREALQEADQLARTGQVSAGLAAQVGAHQTQFLLRQGDREEAAQHVQAPLAGASPPPSHVERVAWVRLLLAQGALRDALHRLDQQLQAAEAQGRSGHTIELLVLWALATHELGDEAGAMVALERALSLAQPEGYVRTFVDEGASMGALLHQALKRGTASEYAGALLAHLEAETPTRDAATARPTRREPVTLIEPLSERELEILRLLATGLTNREIAERLVLTMGTVKWHLHNVYGKLGVGSRTQAVARAREVGLL